jgi:hypothetical protein
MVRMSDLNKLPLTPSDAMLDAAWDFASSPEMSPKFNGIKHDIFLLLKAALKAWHREAREAAEQSLTLDPVMPKLAAYETLMHKRKLVQDSGGWHDQQAFNEWSRLVTTTHRDLCHALAQIVGQRLMDAVLCTEGNAWAFDADTQAEFMKAAQEHKARGEAYLEGQRIKGDPFDILENARRLEAQGLDKIIPANAAEQAKGNVRERVALALLKCDHPSATWEEAVDTGVDQDWLTAADAAIGAMKA